MKITLDGNELTAQAGQTILDVARSQGVDIPTLCHRDDCAGASTSCLVCLVKVAGRFVPACATKIEDGMVVESETDEVRQLRKTSLELLLSDHPGDCHAPCQLACPAGLDIPKMLREIREDDPDAAIRTIKETIPLPAVLGRVCPKPCEKICRRKNVDSPVGICAMKRYAADVDLASDAPYTPALPETSGKHVIVVGAGPSGLSAAYYLTRFGHRVSLYAQGKKPGGRLRNHDPSELPESVLEAEIRTILTLPIDYNPGERLDWSDPEAIPELCRTFDAVLLCTGPCDAVLLEKSGFETSGGRLRVDSKTFTTSIPGVFATGTIFRARTTMIVRSVADGREAALSVDRFLRDGKPHAAEPFFTVKLGKLEPEELIAFVDAHLITNVQDHEFASGKIPATNGSGSTRRAEARLAARPSRVEDDETGSDAAAEAARCLHCDCRGREKCRLLKHAKEYRADLRRFSEAVRRPLSIRRSGDVVFEPGKCIKCGLCISVTKERNETVGLTFQGRGFDVRVETPFDETIQKALEKSAEEAVRVCPTAALSFYDCR